VVPGAHGELQGAACGGRRRFVAPEREWQGAEVRTAKGRSVKDYPIKVGSMLFTLVEPHKGHEVEYNRWYERDHFYAGCMIGPWLFAGRRFVATRALKDVRFGSRPDLFGGRDLGSYLSVYWILAGRHDEHVDW